MRKKIICILIFLVFSMGFGFSEDYTNFLIKIGLNYNEMTGEVVNVKSDDKLSLFFDFENQPNKILDFQSSEIGLSLDNNYHILYEKKFLTIESLENELKNVIKLNSNSFIFYNNGYYMGFGNYKDENASKNDMTKIKGIDQNKLIIIPSFSNIKVYYNNKIYFIYNPNSSSFFIASVNYPLSGIVYYDNSKFRGGIGLKISEDDNISIVNYLLIDHYLYGVLPKEMSVNWPIESLKAQAVVARSFAIRNINKHKNLGYDLCDTSNCQVYGGFDVESVNTNMAVDETRGQLLYYDNKVINGFYHANSGGKTASSEYIWSEKVPYLKSVDDPYSIDCPNTDWSYNISQKEMADKFYQNGYNIGTIKDINIIEKSPSGRVQKIEFLGSDGKVDIIKQEIRKILGYSNIKSIWYDLATDNNVSIYNDILKKNVNLNSIYGFNGSKNVKMNSSGKIYVAGKGKITPYENNSENFTFIGHGNGHGVGMSQWGAKKMAEEGFDYREILSHYYTDTNIKN